MVEGVIKGIKGFQKGNTWGKVFGKPFKKNHTINNGRKHTEEQKRIESLSRMGENHPNWKGGKLKDKDGYIVVLNHKHPLANNMGYVREHRLIMEEFLGRYLTEKEVVHHENEIKDDNKIENLILFVNNIEHKRHHDQLKKQKIS